MGKLRVATRRLLAEQGEAVLPVICEGIAGGQSLENVAKDMKLVVGVLLPWIDAVPDRRKAVDAAYKHFAEAKVSEAIPIADEASREDAAVAKLRIETRLNVAALYDPDRFGKKTQATVTNNMVVLGDSTAKAASALLKKFAPVEIDVTPDIPEEGEKFAYG